MKSKVFKKTALAAWIMAIALVGIVYVNNIMAAGLSPGTASDPLVTKSYVDERINQIMGLLSNGTTAASSLAQPTMPPDMAGINSAEIVRDVMTQMELVYGEKIKELSQTQSQSLTYIPVSARPGQIVIGYEGTEIILRSGSATGYCPGDNGLVNMTSGLEIKNGTAVSINNLLIVPRSDGRGVRASTESWFIVRGKYDIYN